MYIAILILEMYFPSKIGTVKTANKHCNGVKFNRKYCKFHVHRLLRTVNVDSLRLQKLSAYFKGPKVIKVMSNLSNMLNKTENFILKREDKVKINQYYKGKLVLKVFNQLIT